MPADVNDGGFGEAAYCHHRHHLDDHSNDFDTCPHSICVAARQAAASRPVRRAVEVPSFFGLDAVRVPGRRREPSDSVQHEMETKCPKCGQELKKHQAGEEIEMICPSPSATEDTAIPADSRAQSNETCNFVHVDREFLTALAKAFIWHMPWPQSIRKDVSGAAVKYLNVFGQTGFQEKTT